MRYYKWLGGYCACGVILFGGLIAGGAIMLLNAPTTGEPVRRVEATCRLDKSKLDDQDDFLPDELDYDDRNGANSHLWCKSKVTVASFEGNSSAFPMPQLNEEVTMYSEGYVCDYCNGLQGWKCRELENTKGKDLEDVAGKIAYVKCTIFDQADLEDAEQYQNKKQYVVYGHDLDSQYDRTIVQGGAIAMTIIGAIFSALLTMMIVIITLDRCTKFDKEAEPELRILNDIFCMNPLARLLCLAVSPAWVALGCVIGITCVICLILYPCYFVLACLALARGRSGAAPATPGELIAGIAISFPLCLSPFVMLNAVLTCGHPLACCGCGEEKHEPGTWKTRYKTHLPWGNGSDKGATYGPEAGNGQFPVADAIPVGLSDTSTGNEKPTPAKGDDVV